jgi:hypothetical protein
MELVAHGSLDDLMAKHTRVPEANVLQAAIQVAKGLQAAHEKGLLHRDVKPANILFADAETAKIGDFGLAGAADQQIDTEKEIWGTPYYVAPERLNNEPEDFRSDIYSLGATLFHALAGRPPMEGNTTSARELRELKNHPPDIRALTPEITRATARVINKMIAPNPADRFVSYPALIEQLRQATETSGGQGRRAGKTQRLVLFVCVPLLLAVLVAAYFYLRRENKPTAFSVPTPVPLVSITPQPRVTSGSDDQARNKQAAAAENARREKFAREAQEAETRKLLESELPGWEKALAGSRARITVYDFSGALAAVNGANPTQSSLVEAHAAERRRIGWLISWKTKLIGDVNAGRFQTPIAIGRASYTGAAKADETRITFRLPPYGTADVPWVKIPATVLLKMSTSLIQANAPDSADRQWLSAVFASATGQSEAATALAEAAANARPDYRVQLPLLLRPK